MTMDVERVWRIWQISAEIDERVKPRLNQAMFNALKGDNETSSNIEKFALKHLIESLNRWVELMESEEGEIESE